MAEKVCTTCHHIGRERRQMRGSFLMELTLWGLFLIVGILTINPLLLVIPLIYSLWRVFSARKRACPKCGQSTMIPVDTPAAQEILSKTQNNG